MIKVCLADDHNLLRAGLKKIINSAPGIEVVGETDNALKVVEEARASKCDILVLDLSMPGRSGIDVLKDVKAALPNVKTLILSMHPEEQFAKRTIKIGASGYLTKSAAPEDIIKAINKIADGGKYISSTLAELLISDFDNDVDKPKHEKLSEREFQVLCFIAEGKTQVEIAEYLSLSPTTVNTYRSRVLEKLDLKSNAELIKYAFNNNLIQKSP